MTNQREHHAKKLPTNEDEDLEEELAEVAAENAGVIEFPVEVGIGAGAPQWWCELLLSLKTHSGRCCAQRDAAALVASSCSMAAPCCLRLEC